ncbi:hypothetical protein ACQ4PT_035816 [Festuca glaucescens]
MDICAQCGYNECMNKKFTIVLPEGMQNRLIIPCRYRRDFSEHIQVAISDHPRTLEVNLVSLTVPDHQQRVLVTNEEGRTYFSGYQWGQFVERYEMEPTGRLTFYLNEGDVSTYFLYEQSEDSDDTEDDVPRADEDSHVVIIQSVDEEVVEGAEKGGNDDDEDTDDDVEKD